MSVVRWNPLREMDTLFNALSQDNWGNEQLASADWRPSVDIRESDDGYHIAIDVPAVNPKEISVNVKDRILTVSGERKMEKDVKEGKVHRVERSYGRFSRSFVLPENANAEAIQATSKDGVLSLVVGKRPENRPRSIEVQVH